MSATKESLEWLPLETKQSPYYCLLPVVFDSCPESVTFEGLISRFFQLNIDTTSQDWDKYT